MGVRLQRTLHNIPTLRLCENAAGGTFRPLRPLIGLSLRPAICNRRDNRKPDEWNVPDQLNPPPTRDLWRAMQQHRDDYQRHEEPDEWAVERRDADYSRGRGDCAPNP